MERRIGPVLAIAGVWAATWPTAVLVLMAVLTGIMGGGQDVGPLDVVVILTPLALAAGLLFGVIWVVTDPRLPDRRAVQFMVALVLGTLAGTSIGILAGLPITAVYNAAMLGAIAGPMSILTLRTLDGRRRASRTGGAQPARPDRPTASGLDRHLVGALDIELDPMEPRVQPTGSE